MTTATEHRLPHVQHTAEAGGIIPPRFMTIMTIYARAAVSLPGIATRLISDDGGFATDLGKTDHAGRPSGQLHTGLALLGETDEGPCHGRISGSSLLTKYDFGESPERWTQSYSGDFALIFVLILATARPIEIATLSAVDLRTFDQDAPAGHGGPNRVCLFAGTTPKENQEKTSRLPNRSLRSSVLLDKKGRRRRKVCGSTAHPRTTSSQTHTCRINAATVMELYGERMLVTTLELVGVPGASFISSVGSHRWFAV